MSISYAKQLDILYDVDVFVAGGGPSGVAAAVMAARQGKKVFIAEAFGAFGGAAVTMLVPLFMPFSNGVDFLSGGIGREVYNYIAENCHESFKEYCPDCIPVETLKICYDKMVTEAGVQFEFFTDVIDVVTKENSIEYVICSSKSGVYAVKAKIFIDCTGDGDISAMAGAQYEKGDENGKLMAATLCGLWEGMEWDRVIRYDDRELERAFADKVFTSEDRHLSGMFPISHSIGGSNTGHIYNVDGTNAASLTQAMLKGRMLLLEYRKYYKEYLTGYEKMELVISGSCIGVRETRRIVGEYKMTLDDFMKRASFEDEIGRFSYPVDIHSSNGSKEAFEKFSGEYYNLRYQAGESYGIPYRALVVKGLDNLLMAGRCVSSDRYMQSSIRVMPACYIMGQAAGMAAAVALSTNQTIRSLDISLLQKNLKKAGAFLPNCKL